MTSWKSYPDDNGAKRLIWTQEINGELWGFMKRKIPIESEPLYHLAKVEVIEINRAEFNIIYADKFIIWFDSEEERKMAWENPENMIMENLL